MQFPHIVPIHVGKKRKKMKCDHRCSFLTPAIRLSCSHRAGEHRFDDGDLTPRSARKPATETNFDAPDRTIKTRHNLTKSHRKSRISGLQARLRFAPKEHGQIAQGNALGIDVRNQ
jgi:hypothetical protein